MPKKKALPKGITEEDLKAVYSPTGSKLGDRMFFPVAKRLGFNETQQLTDSALGAIKNAVGMGPKLGSPLHESLSGMAGLVPGAGAAAGFAHNPGGMVTHGEPREYGKQNETVVPKTDPEETLDKVSTKSIDVGEPVVIQASAVAPKELAKQIKAAGDNPIIIQDASDLGFSSDEVIVVNRGKGKAKVKPEDALMSVETPVLKTSDFVDTMAFIRKGMGGN
jgi:hypothetical protein